MKKKLNNAFSLIEVSVVILIIGILIAGISSGVDLYQEYKDTSARALSKNSPVNRINDVVLWLDAVSDESYQSYPKNGTQISLLKDIKISDNKINFIQDTQSQKPLFKNSLINGVSALEFDGSDDSLISANSILSQNLSQFGQITIFMVANILTYDKTGVFFKFESGSSRIGLEVNAGGVMRFDYPDGSNRVITTNSFSNKNIVIMAMTDKINQKLFINNELSASNGNSNALASGVSSTIALGMNIGSTKYYTKLYLGELIIFDRAVSDKERNLINNYLSKKWGIKIS